MATEPAAPAPVLEPAPPPPPPALVPPPASEPSKWLPTFYGFVEADTVWDSTQSFDDLAGNTAIQRKGTYRGDHSRYTFGARNSRLGIKLAPPELGGVKTSAQLEMDFFGRHATDASEGNVYSTPMMRMRHAFLKAETPIVDILMGQTWQLFGWQSYFHPNSVNIQGLPGQVFSRSLQLRVGKVIKSDAVNFELQVAAARPVQRDDSLPDGQAGLRLLVNKWKGLRTGGSTGTAVDAAGLGVSGLLRRVRLPDLSSAPTSATSKAGWGVSIDALLPVVPASADNHNNALTLTGSFVIGDGIADMYTNLNGGVTAFPAPPNPDMKTPAPTYSSTIDSGILMFDKDNHPKLVSWQSAMVGLQYYTPIDNGRVWLALNYTNLRSKNTDDFAGSTNPATRLLKQSQFVDANIFFDATAQLRFGLAYSWFEQQFQDKFKAHNNRVQFSGFFIF